MGKIRVLIVDDAVVIRRLVSKVLAADPALEVVGTAASGRIALAKLPQLNPDLIILDVDMPEMNGLQTLAAIRQNYPRLPVLMFSTLTQRGAATTLEALSLGASDYVTKPANVGSVTAALEGIRQDLIPKIKALCPRGSLGELASIRPPLRVEQPVVPTPGHLPIPISPQVVQVLVIGVSTGGPNALAELLPYLPADFPVPTLIVQHMPPLFIGLLAERLNARCAIKVSEAGAGDRLAARAAWLAPGNFHMALQREATEVVVRLHQGPEENSCRPAADVLFRSAAEVYGAGVLAVVLTGMGQDGLRGCEAIREVGGRVLVQDEATSVVWGMPGFVARAGLADRALPLDQLGPEIVRRVGIRAGPKETGETEKLMAAPRGGGEKR